MKILTYCILFACILSSTSRAGFGDMEQGISKSDKSKIHQEIKEAKQNFRRQYGITAFAFIAWAGIGFSSYLISKLYQH